MLRLSLKTKKREPRLKEAKMARPEPAQNGKKPLFYSLEVQGFPTELLYLPPPFDSLVPPLPQLRDHPVPKLECEAVRLEPTLGNECLYARQERPLAPLERESSVPSQQGRVHSRGWRGQPVREGLFPTLGNLNSFAVSREGWWRARDCFSRTNASLLPLPGSAPHGLGTHRRLTSASPSLATGKEWRR